MTLPHHNTIPNGVDMLHVSRFTWVQPGDRFLTDDEKARVLSNYRMTRQHGAAGSGKGADGGLDQRVCSLCDRLNELHGVCTIQSCSGHPMRDGAPALAGQVWLRLSAWASVLFFDEGGAQELAAHPFVYKVARVYLPHGPEVVWIVFQADDEVVFERACDRIVEIFRNTP